MEKHQQHSYGFVFQYDQPHGLSYLLVFLSDFFTNYREEETVLLDQRI